MIPVFLVVCPSAFIVYGKHCPRFRVRCVLFAQQRVRAYSKHDVIRFKAGCVHPRGSADGIANKIHYGSLVVRMEIYPPRRISSQYTSGKRTTAEYIRRNDTVNAYIGILDLHIIIIRQTVFRTLSQRVEFDFLENTANTRT